MRPVASGFSPCPTGSPGRTFRPPRPLEPALAAAPAGSARIDELVARGCEEAGVLPNAPISDETFLRRIYLEVGGRIPTLEEARRFLDSDEPEKRAKLIDELLDSEAFVSRSFNWWADILRVSELVGNNRPATNVYQLWIKDAVRHLGWAPSPGRGAPRQILSRTAGKRLPATTISMNSAQARTIRPGMPTK